MTFPPEGGCTVGEVDGRVGWLRIGQLAEKTGVSAKTLRFFDDAGVLVASARSSAGYRLYDPALVAQVEFVGAAQAAGFSLDEIACLLDAVDGDDDAARAVIRDALARIDQTQMRLERLRDRLAGSHGSG